MTMSMTMRPDVCLQTPSQRRQVKYNNIYNFLDFTLHNFVIKDFRLNRKKKTYTLPNFRTESVSVCVSVSHPQSACICLSVSVSVCMHSKQYEHLFLCVLCNAQVSEDLQIYNIKQGHSNFNINLKLTSKLCENITNTRIQLPQAEIILLKLIVIRCHSLQLANASETLYPHQAKCDNRTQKNEGDCHVQSELLLPHRTSVAPGTAIVKGQYNYYQYFQ